MGRELDADVHKDVEKTHNFEAAALRGWSNLVTPDGSHPGTAILDSIIEDPSIQELIVLGAPCTGKTVLLTGAMRLVEQYSHEQVICLPRTFDQEFRTSQQHLGSRANWTVADWQKFDRSLYDRVQRGGPNQRFGLRVVKGVETVSVGYSVNRGLSFMEKVAEENRAGKRKSRIIALIPDPRTQQKGIFLRSAVLDPATPDEQVEDVLASYNTYAINFAKVLGEEAEDLVARGRLLREKVRGMASAKATLRIVKEIRQEAKILAEADKVDAHRAIFGRPLPAEFDPIYFTNPQKWDLAYHIYYMEQHIRGRLNLSEETASILINPYSEEPMVWDISNM